MAETPLTQGQLLCAFAYANDIGFGLELDNSLRACYVACRVAEQLGLPEDERATVYYTALLKHTGCTCWTTELAEAWQTDEIVARRELMIFTERGYQGSLGELWPWMARYVAHDQSAPSRLARYFSLLKGGRSMVAEGLATTATIACRIVDRIGMSAQVQTAILNLFEQWNGEGAPQGLKGAQIPHASRIVFPTFFLVPLHRVSGVKAAADFAQSLRGRAFDPDVVDAFLDLSADESFWQELEAEGIRERVMAMEPTTSLGPVGDTRIEEIALAFADYVDLKSRFAAAHSRRVAAQAEEIARLMGCDSATVTQIRRAALMHDLGLVAVPSYSLDRPWKDLSETERDQYRLHPYHGERILKQVGPFQSLAEMVGAHHERADGSGYYRGAPAVNISLGAGIVSVADRLDELTHDAPGAPALSQTDALNQVRREPFEPKIVSALAKALGEPQETLPAPKAVRPAGLTEREMEILRLAASGLTKRAIAGQLYISENTVRHHIEHVYNKTGTTNRVSATLFAMENGILSALPV